MPCPFSSLSLASPASAAPLVPGSKCPFSGQLLLQNAPGSAHAAQVNAGAVTNGAPCASTESAGASSGDAGAEVRQAGSAEVAVCPFGYSAAKGDVSSALHCAR